MFESVRVSLSVRQWLTESWRCSITATDFKFDLHVPMDTPDIIPYQISEKGSWPESRDPLKLTWRNIRHKYYRRTYS